MSNRSLVAALAANLLFWPALFVFAALRPDYAHFTRAISELGAFGAPRMLAWNLVGFVVPGLLLAFAGWGIGRRVTPTGLVLPVLLAGAGIGLAMAGLLPADMAYRDGLATLAHLAAADGSLGLWVVALLLLAFRLRGPWRNAALIALASLAATVAAFATADPHTPGLTQRLVFAIFFVSYPLLALAKPR